MASVSSLPDLESYDKLPALQPTLHPVIPLGSYLLLDHIGSLDNLNERSSMPLRLKCLSVLSDSIHYLSFMDKKPFSDDSSLRLMACASLRFTINSIPHPYKNSIKMVIFDGAPSISMGLTL